MDILNYRFNSRGKSPQYKPLAHCIVACFCHVYRLRSGVLNVRNVLNHKVKLGLGTGGNRTLHSLILELNYRILLIIWKDVLKLADYEHTSWMPVVFASSSF